MAKINIGKWIGFGSRLIPIVAGAVSRIQEDKDHLSGPDKKSAVLDIVSTAVETLEGAAQKDIVHDDKVQEATSELIDAIVKVQKAVAAAKEAQVKKAEA